MGNGFLRQTGTLHFMNSWSDWAKIKWFTSLPISPPNPTLGFLVSLWKLV